MMREGVGLMKGECSVCFFLAEGWNLLVYVMFFFFF